MEMMNQQALLDRLRKNQPVKILLEPKRVVVDSGGHPALGAKDAPVTIVEFTDFQCPYCKATEATLKQLRDKYGDKIRLVHMDFPLPFHSHALDAAKAARCANDQGKFWQFHDSLFANQSKLAPADLKATAKTLGMNSTQFDACFDKAKYDSQIKADQAAGEKVGVDGTPAFFIDGRPLTGAQPRAEVRRADRRRAGKRQQHQAGVGEVDSSRREHFKSGAGIMPGAGFFGGDKRKCAAGPSGREPVPCLLRSFNPKFIQH